MKSYRETKEYLTQQLIQNVSSEKEIKKYVLTHSLDKSERLYNAILQIGKRGYFNESLDTITIMACVEFNIKKLKSGWYYVNNDFAKGKFVNANKVLENVYCEAKECHQSAYQFMLEYDFQDLTLHSGTIKPYKVGSGILHSICTFKIDNHEYVFDGANYLIIDKKLYYDIFNFNELQRLSKKMVVEDRLAMARKDITAKGILKTTKKYNPVYDFENLCKRFSGMGFIMYLYNRDMFVGETMDVDDLERENIEAIDNLNKKINEMIGSDEYNF